jgi:4-hydroxybenzoate polyprenyltransferase
MMLAFLKCLRPKQWTKNLLLFAGIIFARRWNDPEQLLHAIGAFAIFCALSGVVYITNDILDVEKDRKHPRKCRRPIASGAITPTAAAIGAVLLLAGSLAAAWAITVPFFWCAVIYVALVTAYSFKLKHLVILDIMVLAMGFVVRALAGIEAIAIAGKPEVEVTSYFILTTLFLALFLAIAKRRNELVTLQEGAGDHRRVLADYSTEFLDVLLTVATTGVIASYAAWALSGNFSKADGVYTMIFTMPFVLYGIFRYLWLVFRRDEGGAPEQLLLTDKPLLITVVLWVAMVVALLSIGGLNRSDTPILPELPAIQRD